MKFKLLFASSWIDRNPTKGKHPEQDVEINNMKELRELSIQHDNEALVVDFETDTITVYDDYLD